MGESIQPSTHQNPFQLENEWRHGSPDPQLLRYNGRYYLYPSTDMSVGIKAWSSIDLVHWKYEGFVAKEPVTYMAWDPHVVYSNGVFYLYSSPGGKGHYVFTSDSPTGPFTVQTGNLGFSIAGTVLIDDDGKWYFAHSGPKGIVGRRLETPTQFSQNSTVLNSYLNHWTEGGKIFKRAGVYYLTYTGNHWLSDGYRIGYSIAKDGPLGSYRIPANNPLVINTESDFRGLGNGFTIIGPDLDSYYMFYHNLIGNVGDKPRVRHLNMDRVVFNGEVMFVLGPTDFLQQAPKMPDYYTWIDEEGSEGWQQISVGKHNLLLSTPETKALFTAEFNFQVDKSSAYKTGSVIGAVFSYKDGDNYTYAAIDPATSILSLVVVTSGREQQLGQTQLPVELDYSKLHTIRVAHGEQALRISFDNMEKIVVKGAELQSGKIGYLHAGVQPVFKYTAFSNDSGGSSDYNAYKPIPGSIEAVHYVKENGYHSSQVPQGSNPVRVNDSVEVRDSGEGSYAGSYAVSLFGGDWLKYNVNVRDQRRYAVDLLVRNPRTEAVAALYKDDDKLLTFTISPSAKVPAGDWVKIRVGALDLASGLQSLKLMVASGSIDVKSLHFYEASSADIQYANSLDQGLPQDWEYYGKRGAATWLSTEMGLSPQPNEYTIATFGEPDWTDYAVEFDVTLGERPLAYGGVIFRATNASYHEHQTQDSFMGYYLAINSRRIMLQKVNYGMKTVASVPIASDTGVPYRIKVEVVGNQIKVYRSDMEAPLLEYWDPDPYMHGKVGFRSESTQMYFRNVAVRTIDGK